MPFDTLKKKLGGSDDDSDVYLQPPVDIPGTEGLDPSASQQAFLGQMLNKTLGVGDDVKTADSIQPVSSPIDTMAYLAGGSLGGALARDAGSVVGNEVGAVGSNVNPSPYFQQKLDAANSAANAAPNLLDMQRQMNKAGVADRALQREAAYAALKNKLRR